MSETCTLSASALGHPFLSLWYFNVAPLRSFDEPTSCWAHVGVLGYRSVFTRLRAALVRLTRFAGAVLVFSSFSEVGAGCGMTASPLKSVVLLAPFVLRGLLVHIVAHHE